MKKIRAWQVMAVFIVVLALVSPPRVRSEDFSQERAYAHLKYLAETVGPRPLGSPQERAALSYFAGRMAEIGADVEWQPVTGTGQGPGESALNTESFNVIGRLRGESAREIVVGAHIDSAGPEIPGADDDGSGVATILEAARVAAARPHRATLVFVAFCGEEAGLIGSRSFVSSRPLTNVALMIELDMTSGDSPLMLWIDTTERQTPAWLVSASVDIFHDLGYRDLDYPTIFQSLNNAVGGAGSDHEPFLEKNIPAIAFVSDIRFPIHTPFDNLSRFRPDGLTRSGRLVLGLLDRFDKDEPGERAGHYALVMAGGRPIYVRPPWMAGFVALALVVGLAGLLRLYANRKTGDEKGAEKKIKKSWPKLICLHFIMLVAAFASFWLIGFVKGVRLPWVLHPGAYIAYALVFFVLGIWLSLQVLRAWRLRHGAFFYGVRASALLSAFIILAWTLSGPRLAAFPAAGLLCLGLAWLARPAWVKGILWLASAVPMFRLFVLPEYYPFLYRGIGDAGLASVRSVAGFAAVNLAVVLFTVAWTEPFLLGFAAVYRAARGDLFGLKRFRGPVFLIPLGVLIIGGGFVLCRMPSYAPPWMQSVVVKERAGGDTPGTSIDISSGDYLDGIVAEIGGRTLSIGPKSCFFSLKEPLSLDWLRADASARLEGGGGARVAVARFDLSFVRQPLAVSLRIDSDKPFEIREANFHFARAAKSALLRWQNDPPAHLQPELKIGLAPGAGLDAEVSAVFLDTPLPVRLQGKDKTFVYRSEIRRRLKIVAAGR